LGLIGMIGIDRDDIGIDRDATIPEKYIRRTLTF
jgi:hypothetical protein